MPEVKFIDHLNEKVLLIDFSNAKDNQEIVGIAEEAMRIVKSTNQQSSILGLLDFSGTSLNKTVRESMMKMSKSNRIYMKSVAFTGFGVLMALLFKGLLFVAGKSNHKVFSTRCDALDWLVRT